MNAVLLAGDQPRHRHVAARLAGAGLLGGLVVEARGPFVPEPPAGLDRHLAQLWRRHFAARAAAEERFFGDSRGSLANVPTLRVERAELNSDRVAAFVEGCGADAAISYGVHILRPETLDRFPPLRWNLHGGLSPWFRGAITLFWPSYLLQPQFTGMTVHELTRRLDGGPVIHQVTAPLVRGDGIHDLACRAVLAAADELPGLLALAARGELREPQRQKGSGKLWLAADWRPEHLRLVHDLYRDRIVDAYLDGELHREEPELVRQFPAGSLVPA